MNIPELVIVIQFNRSNEEISNMIDVFTAMSFLLMNTTHSNTSNAQQHQFKMFTVKRRFTCALLWRVFNPYISLLRDLAIKSFHYQHSVQKAQLKSPLTMRTLVDATFY